MTRTAIALCSALVLLPHLSFAQAPAPAPATPATPAPNTGDIEGEYWNRIVGSQHADDFDDYLKEFPEGKHAPLAKLEAKRLRRDGSTAPAERNVARAAASPVAPETSAQADATRTIDESFRQVLANEPFFRIPTPEGNAVPIRRSGKQLQDSTPVSMTVRRERIGQSNVCQFENDIVFGGSAAGRHLTKGTAWAGLVNLDATTVMDAGGSAMHVAFRVERIDELVGQPFPLVAGNKFGFRVRGTSVLDGGRTSSSPISYSCQVGATGPAHDVIPGMPGEQTEVKCTLNFHSSVMRPQEAVMQWFSAAGCFAQDPGSP